MSEKSFRLTICISLGVIAISTAYIAIKIDRIIEALYTIAKML